MVRKEKEKGSRVCANRGTGSPFCLTPPSPLSRGGHGLSPPDSRMNDGTPIIDGERGLVATLKERNKPASIDLISMAKHPEMEEHIIEAARTGMLNASLTPLRAMKGKAAWADALLGMEMPGGVNSVLTIQDTTKGS